MSHVDHIARLQDQGFCVLKAQYTKSLVAACRQAFWPILLSYLESHHLHPNRGPHRHSLPMPFEPPCFAPEFFFDADVLSIVHGVLGDRLVADQWSCDVPVRGSVYQKAHADFQRPLFAEYPDFVLPAYMLVVSFGLIDITPAHGPLEIAPRTHRMPRHEALRAVEAQEIEMEPVLLALGDVLIRHPWTLHRGTPNLTDTPRSLISVRYARSWYVDNSREVSPLPRVVWQSLSPTQQCIMRFPILGS